LPNLSFDDPRDHNQSSITRLDFDDMNSAMNCPISLVYLGNGKRAGTMSYCELGAARANGNCIVAVDENEEKDSLIEQIASNYFTSKQKALEFLKESKFNPDYNSIKKNDKTSNKNPCRNILFTGNLEEMNELIEEVSKYKKVYTRPPINGLDDFSEKFDTVVVNFKKGEDHNKHGLYHMGLAYATKVPIIELEGNSAFPYPPLLGLARRVFTGKQRFTVAQEYLKQLGSQHIADEAKLCYELMNKFNK